VAVTTSTGPSLIFQPADCAAFPIVINTPGSYKLAQNIQLPGSCAKNGIEVSAHNVTLDMNGFALVGTPGITGIFVGSFGGTAIRNGIVRSWIEGIDTSNSTNNQVSDVQLYDNQGSGLRTGQTANISGVTVVTPTSGRGIVLVGGRSVVRDCAVAGVSGSGDGIVIAGVSNTVTGCTIEGAGRGIYVTASGNIVTGNAITNTTAEGIQVEGGSGNTISRNNVFGADAESIEVAGLFSFDNRIDENHVAQSVGIGILIGGSRNLVMRNTSEFNTGSAYSIGVGNQAGPISTLTLATNPWANMHD
jgi:parallel beta-helix repeat protein